MTNCFRIILYTLFLICSNNSLTFSATEIPADNPFIQYYGRWDFSNPLAPKHSWPGVYIYAEFEGTSIGVKMQDNVCYYNVFIDGQLSTFHPLSDDLKVYTLKTGLADGHHSILITKRSETNWTAKTFNGFVLDDGKTLLSPPERLARKIEFIGDSFTCASGNEAPDNNTPANIDLVTNIYEGFAPITARHFDAQYHLTSRSGYGLVMDYLGNSTGNIPDDFDRALCYTNEPKWDFELWKPNLVVICLGLNDYSGFGGWNGTIPEEKRDLFKSRYHEFLSSIRDVYPTVKILAVAAHLEWIQSVVSEVVEEEHQKGNNDVFYTYFPYYEGGYVNQGHPNVGTHHKIADRLISAIDTIDAWTPYDDKIPPKFTAVPESPFTAHDTTYLLKIQTDSYCSLRYSTADKNYDEMENEFSITGTREHKTTISVSHNKNYTFYIKAKDMLGNVSASPAIITFSVDTTKSLLTWKAEQYNDTGWKKGTAPLGTSNSTSPATILDDVQTAYLRKNITIENIEDLTGFALMIKGKDGAIIYVNGKELSRVNMPDDENIFYNTLAAQSTVLNKSIVINSSTGFDKFRNGENIIAIEMHSSSSTTPVLSFDSQIFDSKNHKYYTLGSEWSYYDGGDSPADQLKDKVTSVVNETTSLPVTTVLYDNFPNPFNPETNISFYLDKASFVELRIYNVLGKLIETLESNLLERGSYKYKFSAENYSSGIYFFQLRTNDYNKVKKMTVLK